MMRTTQREEAREAEWGHPESWQDWEADSLDVAKAVEDQWVDRGMDGHHGGNFEPQAPTWNYIFLVDELD